jgi:LPS O-antigen subunit length determinant protein (WzzB/FepE family)
MNRAERDYISYLNTHNLSAQGQHAEKIEIQYLARKLSGEMEGYFMAIKNVEIAKSALDLQRPLLQAIDKPIYPLERTNPPSAIMALILGIIIGFVLGVVLVIGQKLGKDLWKNNKQKILDNFNGNTNNDSTSLESKLPTP